jgi:hypothetical protein
LLEAEGAFQFIWSHYYPTARRFNIFSKSRGAEILDVGFLFGYKSNNVISELTKEIEASFRLKNKRVMDDNEGINLTRLLKEGHLKILLNVISLSEGIDFLQRAKNPLMMDLFNERTMDFLWNDDARAVFSELAGKFIRNVPNILSCCLKPHRCGLLRDDQQPYSTIPTRRYFIAYLNGKEERLEIVRRLGKYCIFICNIQHEEEAR